MCTVSHVVFTYVLLCQIRVPVNMHLCSLLVVLARVRVYYYLCMYMLLLYMFCATKLQTTQSGSTRWMIGFLLGSLSKIG